MTRFKNVSPGVIPSALASDCEQLSFSILTLWGLPLLSRPLFPSREVFRTQHSMKTFSAKAQEQNPTWWVIDAKNQILGDVAVAAANLLRGKTKPTFTPHVDTGDFVVVLNAAEVRLSGKKEQQKIYTSKAGYVGNQKIENVERVRARRPELLVERAVKGMVPHNRLGRAIMGKLKIYSGAAHPHEAQNPKAFAVA